MRGNNLPNQELATIMFDGRPCTVQSQSSESLLCLTSDKPYVEADPSLEFSFAGVGNVATQGLVFRYVSMWSDPDTWGNDSPPLEGDLLQIPTG